MLYLPVWKFQSHNEICIILSKLFSFKFFLMLYIGCNKDTSKRLFYIIYDSHFRIFYRTRPNSLYKRRCPAPQSSDTLVQINIGEKRIESRTVSLIHLYFGILCEHILCVSSLHCALVIEEWGRTVKPLLLQISRLQWKKKKKMYYLELRQSKNYISFQCHAGCRNIA